jgi:serine/threonine-protein kinase
MNDPPDPNSHDSTPKKSEAGDRYQLLGEISRGDTSAVLHGRDVDLGRDIAIKVLLGKHVARPEVARRFIQEAQIAGQLQHPGVVPVYDIGRFGDRPFFTMKPVRGRTLAAILAERADVTTDRPRLLRIALLAAQTLAYAHAKGVIHRDIKPADIMVGAFGEVQVVDWSVAKVLAQPDTTEEVQTSRAGATWKDVSTLIRNGRNETAGIRGPEAEADPLLGTPAYMAPEQASSALVDRRADVFGLGGILCEILTGKPPYVGRSAQEVWRKAANGDLAEANARLEASGADAELIALTRACLSPEPIRRPKDALELANALSSYLEGVQHRLREAGFGELIRAVNATQTALRDKAALANLSPQERQRLSNLLEEAAALLKKAGGQGDRKAQ